MKNIAIVGAGLAGLTAARGLSKNSNIQIFEKSWRAGGRMSSRQKGYHYDHGAQYFTARSSDFKTFLSPFIQQGIITRWDANFIELDRDAIVRHRQWNAEYPHYIAVPGMNALCQALATDLDVQYDTHVTSIQTAGAQWALKANEYTSLGTFDWVITAVPAQQAAALMPGVFTHSKQLRQKKMQACFTLMLGFDQPLRTDFDCAMVNNADISWISVNSSKPGRPKDYTLVIHSSNSWAEANISLDNDNVKIHLIKEACDVLKRDITKARHISLHRWLYANINKQAGAKALIDTENKLAAIGDWCIKGRVESAFISASELTALQFTE